MKAHTLVETLQSKILAHEKVISRFVKNRGETQLEKVQEVRFANCYSSALNSS